MQQDAFAAALARDVPLLLDGGLATQLEAQGCDISNHLWSASLLLDDPQAIVHANRAFLDAGAECIATASYQASREGFAMLGLSAAKADDLIRLSVELAIRARDEFCEDNPGTDVGPLVAASIGPYGAMLHDGSEYRGNYGVSAALLRDFHVSRLRLFDACDVDVLALETIPSLLEAEVLVELLSECDKPSWVSFSCEDEKTISDGTPVEDVARIFAGHPNVMAIGLNCTPPQYVTKLIRRFRDVAPDKAVIAYPNSGETYNVETNSWSGTVTPLDFGNAARKWVEAGAKVVGGCCRTGPDHIRAIRGALR